MLITLEGPDGAGKTTQQARLVGTLRDFGYPVVAIHEPGGTALGDAVRGILVRRAGPAIDPWSEALLFAACRAQLVQEVVRPALARGEIVIADRFADSTRAYQGGGRGLARTDLEVLIRIATGGLTPDLTLLLDVPSEVGLARLRPGVSPPRHQATFFEEIALPEAWNRFEDEARSFHENVRAVYLELARVDPARWVRVDAASAPDAVAEEVWRTVHARIRDFRTAGRA